MTSTTYMPYKAAARCSFLSFTNHLGLFCSSALSGLTTCLLPFHHRLYFLMYKSFYYIPRAHARSNTKSKKMENYRLKTKYADDLFYRGTPDFNNLEIRSTWNGKVDEPADLRISLEVYPLSPRRCLLAIY